MLDQIELTVIYLKFYSVAEEITFFTSTYGTFFRIYYILSPPKVSINLRKLKSNEYVSDHHMKLKISHQKKCEKLTNR